MIVDVIIPALNEEATIGAVVESISRALVRNVVVVDNGSADATAKRAAAAGALVPTELLRGYGAACQAGVAYVGRLPSPPDVVAFMDADGADDPADLAKLLSGIAGGADLVLGARVAAMRERGSMTRLQRWGNALATALLRLRHGVRFADLGPFRAIRLDALRSLGLRDRGFGWTMEMQVLAARRGLRVIELPVGHRCRRGGHSKISGTWAGSLRAGAHILYETLRSR